MSNLTARLGALLRLHAAAFDERRGDDARLGEQFRRDMELLVAQYGCLVGNCHFLYSHRGDNSLIVVETRRAIRRCDPDAGANRMSRRHR
jgi:hypothetical protein